MQVKMGGQCIGFIRCERNLIFKGKGNDEKGGNGRETSRIPLFIKLPAF
jgi:hypothetical protein